jgi:RNA polymerase sigma factor (sigma-70 family)
MTKVDLAAFIENNYKFIENFCRKKVNFSSRDAGNDAVQGAILKILLNAHKYSDNKNSSFRTWAMTVAKNHCLDYVRVEQNIRKKNISIESMDPWVKETIGAKEFSDELEDEQERVIAELKLSSDMKRLKSLLGDLSDNERKIILLRYVQSSIKTGLDLGMNTSTVRHHCARILKNLTAKMITKEQFFERGFKAPRPSGRKALYTAMRTEAKKQREIRCQEKIDSIRDSLRIKEMEKVLQNYNWD